MRTQTLVKAVGNDAFTSELQKIRRAVDEMQIFDSETVKVQKTTRGLRLTAKIPPSTAGGSADENFKGVYTAGAYNSEEWVVIQAGPGQGAYISTADGNTNDPRTGINWIQFSSLNQWF
jgi:hypothetical protein